MRLAPINHFQEERLVCNQQYSIHDKDGIVEHPIQLPCKHVLGNLCAEAWFKEQRKVDDYDNWTYDFYYVITCPFCRAESFERAVVPDEDLAPDEDDSDDERSPYMLPSVDLPDGVVITCESTRLQEAELIAWAWLDGTHRPQDFPPRQGAHPCGIGGVEIRKDIHDALKMGLDYRHGQLVGVKDLQLELLTHVRRAVPSAQIYDGSLGEDPTPAHEADLLLQLLFRCILDKLIWYAAVVGERFHVMTDEDGHFEYAEF